MTIDIGSLVVKAELHCHNIHSNFHVGAQEPPYDCGISVRSQLEQANQAGLDAIFVTNHNTLAGYRQLLECRNEHRKFQHIGVYPAEEITTDSGAHVLAYGIHKEIPPNLGLADILDRIRDQGGVSSAPHPFSLLDALRDDAVQCDMIEVFNSNNIDVISNSRAAEFASSHNMAGVAGSDSHVVSTLGRCTNMVDAENNLDDIIRSMKRGHITIDQSGYARPQETLEHLQYKIRNSAEYLEGYIKENYPNTEWLLNLLLQTYNAKPDSILWTIFYRLGVYLMNRISVKVNTNNVDPEFMKQRDLGTMLRMAL